MATAKPNHHYTVSAVKFTESSITPRALSESKVPTSESNAPTSQSSKPSNQSSDPSRQSNEPQKQLTESSRPSTISMIHSIAPSTMTKSTIHGSENPSVVTTSYSTSSPCKKYKFTTAIKSKLRTVKYAVTTKITNSEGFPTGLSHSDEWDNDDDRRK